MYALVLTILTTTLTPTGFNTTSAAVVRLYPSQEACNKIAYEYAIKKATDINEKSLFVMGDVNGIATTTNPNTTVISCVKV